MSSEEKPTQVLIRKLQCRDTISFEEQKALENLLEPVVRIPAGAAFVCPNDEPSRSILLMSGICARFNLMRDGSRSLTQISVPGDFVDLHSLLMKHMDHGVVAITDCEISKAPHESLIRVIADHPHLGRLLWLDTVIDGAIHRQWLHRMGTQDATGRLAHLICEMEARLEVVGLAREGGFDFPLTQVDLADCLGLSPVHINRTLMTLRRLQLIEWRGGHVQVLSRDRLCDIAEFDPTYLRLHSAPV